MGKNIEIKGLDNVNAQFEIWEFFDEGLVIGTGVANRGTADERVILLMPTDLTVITDLQGRAYPHYDTPELIFPLDAVNMGEGSRLRVLTIRPLNEEGEKELVKYYRADIKKDIPLYDETDEVPVYADVAEDFDTTHISDLLEDDDDDDLDA